MAEHVAIELKKFLKPAGVVLIRAGASDDASCYHAKVGSMVGPNAFIVYFHSSSLLLERVFTQGSVLVEVDFFGEESYTGELKLYEQGRPTDDACALIVRLYDEKKRPVFLERLCPMT